MNQMILGDCLEVMSEIHNQSIDLIITDLPYGTTNNINDKKIPLDLLWKQYKRIRKPACPILLFAVPPYSYELYSSNPKEYKYEWTWIKNRPSRFLDANRRPMLDSEYILVFYEKQPFYNPQMVQGKPNHKRGRSDETVAKSTYANYHGVESTDSDMKYPRTTLYFDTVAPAHRLHPSQKPVELLSYLIKTYSRGGDTILDNTMGVGSTGIAALENNRSFIGIEKDPAYFEKTQKRFAESGIDKTGKKA